MSLLPAQLVVLMEDAVAFSVRHVESGGLPFVGVIVDEAGYVSEYGVNQVQESGDPSAHAEIVAMRATLRRLTRCDLSGMYLLATGEPCGLCYRFALQNQVEQIYVAVDSDTVAARGFDYRASYRALNVDRSELLGVVVPLPVPNGLEPFDRYLGINQSGRYVMTRRPASGKGSS